MKKEKKQFIDRPQWQIQARVRAGKLGRVIGFLVLTAVAVVYCLPVLVTVTNSVMGREVIQAAYAGEEDFVHILLWPDNVDWSQYKEILTRSQ